MKDIEIARSIKLDKITDVANGIGIMEDEIEQYGNYKAKLDNEAIANRLKEKKDGKLILVTSINPTPLGEGKTTIAIGLTDGLRKIGKKSILALREPSLGPVFGIKGGATGGGYSQVAPMEDINLHFNGDIHAITSANNLLSALIDNHIYYGNELQFDKVIWKRCVDLNDRQLRKVETGLSGEKYIVPREDGFDISVASEIMAILCLATDIKDLKRRIGNIIVGYNKNGKPITARDLHAGLEITDRFSRWFERMSAYGFAEGNDFTSVKTSTLVNNGAEREITDYQISVDMAKQICMIQRSEKADSTDSIF